MSSTSPFRLPEAYSLYGEPLYPRPIGLWMPTDPIEREKKIRELLMDREKMLREYITSPEDPEKLLWYARKTEIVGNFNEAVAAYTEGIRKWPEDARFHRFRGHRFALLRRLDLAIIDLSRAGELIRGQPDEVEVYASGGASKDKLGASSFHWNIWYHLGFSHFAAGNHEEAVKAYRNCMDTVDVPESMIATKHWLYMPLIRLARWKEAEKLLEDIEPGQTPVEVDDYYDTLLAYKGVITLDELLEGARAANRFLVKGQAVANLYLARGEFKKAVDIYRETQASGEWTAGVSLIAEAELQRLGIQP